MKNIIENLQVLFIYLKLTNQIDWSWWLVLIPLTFLVLKLIGKFMQSTMICPDCDIESWID